MRGARVRSDNGTYEIHLAQCLDPMDEVDDDGETRDMRLPLLLAYLRDRDGFELPWRASWAQP